MIGIVWAGPWPMWHRLDVTRALAGWFAFAVLLFATLWIWPTVATVPRRAIGIGADVGIITWAMLLAGELGVAFFCLYFWITFGNLFRYGRAYAFACQLLCVIGFIVVIVTEPWWRTHLGVSSGLLVGLIVVPLYVSVLLSRLQQQ
jgi:two-component system, sensor histidine kinase RpfC